MIDTNSNDTREKAAAVQHRVWEHWMRYLFSVSDATDDGEIVIPADKVKRWMRQMDTDYADLTPQEQASDLDMADWVMEALAPSYQLDVESISSIPTRHLFHESSPVAGTDTTPTATAYFYLINNGESYSDFLIRAILRAERPVDWAAVAQRIQAALTSGVDTVDGDGWWLSDEDAIRLILKHGAEYGLSVVEFAEFSADGRSVDGVWDFECRASEWKNTSAIGRIRPESEVGNA